MLIQLYPRPLKLYPQSSIFGLQILQIMSHGLELSLDWKKFIVELLHLFAGLVSVLHFLDKDLLRYAVDLVVLLDELLVKTGDLLFQEGRLVGEFGDSDLASLKLIVDQGNLGFKLRYLKL